MKPLIECCEQNLAKGAQLLLEDIFIQKNSDIVTYSCLNECQSCAQYYYVLFEGERIVSSSIEGLKEKIITAIELWKEEMGNDV